MFRPAKKTELNRILKIYDECKKKLLANNIFQWGSWNNNYPNMEFIVHFFSLNELLIYKPDNTIIGAVVLNNRQDKEWNSIPWNSPIDKALIIHAMVIDPKFHGNGYGKKLLNFSEQYAKNKGAEYIRLDAFEKNIASYNLYTGNNYKVLGNVSFDSKPEGNKIYVCFEKNINQENDAGNREIIY